MDKIEHDAKFAAQLEVPNMRRMSIDGLIYRLQDISLDQFYHPGKQGQNKYIYESRIVKAIKAELERRKNMPDNGNLPNVNIIEAIKERADIIEVLGKFTDVFVYQKKWTYRCTLHGADKHPSGVIYPNNKCYCHVCHKGGDSIDVAELFGKMDKRQAISWLAKFYGIDTKILPAQIEATENKPWMDKYIRALVQ